MPVDNQLYDKLAHTWWDDQGVLSILRAALNPLRFGYFREVLADGLRIDPRGRRALDVGCGGGFLAEEFARLGCRVSGIDPSVRSLAAARAHARQAGLEIEYLAGAGEEIPFAGGSFEIAYCCDVLEHVRDLDKVIAETARVLAPGGVYFYDTINRTLKSKLILIKLLQEWEWSRCMPPRLHDWNMFIKPEELDALLARHGLEKREVVGLVPGVNPLKIIAALRARRRGEISYAEFGRRIEMRRSRHTGILYMGYAIRTARAPTCPTDSAAASRTPFLRPRGSAES